MDSDKAGSLSCKGYGGHVQSRLAGFQNRLFIKFCVDLDRAFCNAGFAMLTTNWEVEFGLQSNLFDFLTFHRSIKLGCRNVFKMYKVSCILMNMRCTFHCNHLAMFFTWRLKIFSPFALLWALINEALVARVLPAAFERAWNAACRA